MTLVDLVEIFGSLLILAAFAAVQLGKLDGRSVPYLVLNVVGAGVLAVIALMHQSWGFLLLEGTWTIVSAISLAAKARARRRAATPRGQDVVTPADRPAPPPAHRA